MGKNSNLDTLSHLKLHLSQRDSPSYTFNPTRVDLPIPFKEGSKGRGLSAKVVILGVGNTLRSDDGVGSILVNRIKDRVPYIVYDGSSSPENYLGKIIKDKPDNILIIDAVDFGGLPGEFRVLEGENVETVSFFSTHDASISLAINYLKKSLPQVDIFILAVQPKIIAFGDNLSPEIIRALKELEGWFANG